LSVSCSFAPAARTKPPPAATHAANSPGLATVSSGALPWANTCWLSTAFLLPAGRRRAFTPDPSANPPDQPVIDPVNAFSSLRKVRIPESALSAARRHLTGPGPRHINGAAKTLCTSFSSAGDAASSCAGR